MRSMMIGNVSDDTEARIRAFVDTLTMEECLMMALGILAGWLSDKCAVHVFTGPQTVVVAKPAVTPAKIAQAVVTAVALPETEAKA